MRRWFAAFVFAVSILGCALLAMLSLLVAPKKGPTFAMRLWAKLYLLAAGVKVEVEGIENVTLEPSLYLSNHASVLDIPVLVEALPVDLRFIYKKSLGYVPLVGWAMFLMGMVPIDRGRRKKAIESLKKAGRRIRKGYQVLIFPEGTRTRTGELLPFKKGGFLLAKQAKLPMIPISVLNSQQLGGRNSLLAGTGLVKVIIHPKVSAEDVRSGKIEDLLQNVRNQINQPFIV